MAAASVKVQNLERIDIWISISRFAGRMIPSLGDPVLLGLLIETRIAEASCSRKAWINEKIDDKENSTDWTFWMLGCAGVGRGQDGICPVATQY